jgi:hypothetical protein
MAATGPIPAILFGPGMKKLSAGSQSDCDAGVLLRSSLTVKRHRNVGVDGLI